MDHLVNLYTFSISTVKGVNFFGPGSQYVVSGSDCGNIFFWHRETEAIVQCMPGDENGVVGPNAISWLMKKLEIFACNFDCII